MSSKWWKRVLAALVIATGVGLIFLGCAPVSPRSPTTATPDSARAMPTTPTAKPETTSATIAPLSPPVNVKVATIRVLADAGTIIAFEKGYFRDLGIDVNLIPFGSGPALLPVLAKGDLDVGRGGISAGFFNAVRRGLSMKVVADAWTVLPTPDPRLPEYFYFVVRKDLRGQIREIRDLRGKIVAAPPGGSSGHIHTLLLLEKGGLTDKDVTLENLELKDMAAALAGKSVDVGYLSEPWVTQLLEQDVIVRWKAASEVALGRNTSMLMFSAEFAKKTEVANRFIVAYVKGLRDYRDAFVKGKAKAEVIDMLAKGTDVKDPKLYEKMGFLTNNPDGYVNVKAIQADADFLLEHGMLDGRVDVSSLVDNSFLDYAIGKLGRYEK